MVEVRDNAYEKVHSDAPPVMRFMAERGVAPRTHVTYLSSYQRAKMSRNIDHSLKRPSLSWTGILLLLTLSAPPLMAESVTIPFSADVTRSRPDKKNPHSRGKMFVSKDGVRGESLRDGIQIVMIYPAIEKTTWILAPDQKIYSERKGISPSRPFLPDDPNSPCRRDKSLICRAIGTEKIDSRQTIHWEIAQRGPDHLEIPQAHLWIDTRLGIAIRERYADGLQVELSNIQEGPQPVELFQIPKDYQKQAP
ncbi:MAG: hypothetical protein HQL86_00075 [Magnetococcales bacterium]|nr:hypothetical protein [Magnetococcales bacterium]